MRTARIPLVCMLLAGLLGPLHFPPEGGAGPQPGEQVSRPERQPLLLDVAPLQQAAVTSCGEAAIAMAYNFLHQESPISEQAIIDFSTASQYFTPRRYPFTSPENMVRIARHYSIGVSTGAVWDAERALALLKSRLRQGQPVIIDVLVRRYQAGSGAHFIVVTGISIDRKRGSALMIHFNEPLTGTREKARWAGPEGIWNAWLRNNDPGGSGWWLTLSE